MGETLIVLAHGAGAPSTSPWMLAWRDRLRTVGEVVSFDYPYLAEGRRRPDPHERLVEAHLDALRAARAGHQGRVVLAGKSMGGRIGAHAALAAPVNGLVFFGYPLCGAGKRDKLRDRVLLDTRVPCLFIQGTRDALAPLDLLDGVLRQMRARTDLLIVDGGDHSLTVGKRTLHAAGERQSDVDERILARVRDFIATL